jgi:hypothetical protein
MAKPLLVVAAGRDVASLPELLELAGREGRRVCVELPWPAGAARCGCGAFRGTPAVRGSLPGSAPR